MDLTPHCSILRQLSRSDPDPRVRHRADGLLLVAGGISLSQAARHIGCSRNSIRSWADRFLAEGRDGLVDRRRLGRPHKLDAEARELLETALTASPLDYDYPVTTWTVVDLTDLLAQRGWPVHPITVYRALHVLGYRYRRPRYDLTYRQDVEAVASAKQVLCELQKRGLLTELDSALSMWMNVASTPDPTWQKFGNAEGVR